MGRPVGQQRVFGRRDGRLAGVTFVPGRRRQDIAEHGVQAPAQFRGRPFRLIVHPLSVLRCDDGGMTFNDKAKQLADTALEWVGENSEKAGEKVAELTGSVREKAPGYVDRAAELAGRAAGATAAGVDRATGGRFHDQIDAAHTVVEETLDRLPKAPPTASGSPFAATTPAEPAATGDAGPPITPATTNPDAE